MVDIGLLYVGGVTLLFFFWVYGIISFVHDAKHKFLPLVRGHLRGRRQRERDHEREPEEEREERERQLY